MEKKKIYELDISEDWKRVLVRSVKGITIMDAAIMLNIHYNTAAIQLRMFEARNWLKRKVLASGRYKYFLNRVVLEN